MNIYIFYFSLIFSVFFSFGCFGNHILLGKSVSYSLVRAIFCFPFLFCSGVGLTHLLGEIFGFLDSGYIFSIAALIFPLPLFHWAEKIFENNNNVTNIYNEVLPTNICFEFIYKDANGYVQLRQVKNVVISDDRFDAFCKLRMATRTFVLERIQGDVTDLQTGECINKRIWFERMGGESFIDYSLISDDEFDSDCGADFQIKPRSSFFSDDEYNEYIKNLPERELIGKRIYFTGFSSDDRHFLNNMAVAEKMIVCSSVDSNVDYCVIGSTNTPRRKKSFFEAKKLGIPVFDCGAHFFHQATIPTQIKSNAEDHEINYLNGEEILFTGFKYDVRSYLEDSARACGMIVRTKVTKNLSYLVCGPKDAPAKRLEAINVGASIVYGEDEFRDLITG